MLRRSRAALVGILALAFAALACGSAVARDENPDGFGIYSPLDRKQRIYRYDPRSWYYRQPGYYPYYGSSYWVPRAHMRYRYRYTYFGPRYRYYPSWGYPLWEHSDDGCCHRGR